MFAKNFSTNSNLDDSLRNISVTPKLVKKVITNLDLSQASGSDFITVIILKNCEPELSNIPGELFNMCLKESCFPDCWKVSSMVPVVENVGERSAAKNYSPVSLLPVVCKVFEKPIFNRLVDHLEKCGFFFISSMALGLLDQRQIF